MEVKMKHTFMQRQQIESFILNENETVKYFKAAALPILSNSIIILTFSTDSSPELLHFLY